MSSPFKTREFAALKAKWDKKLAKSGFDDIEDKNGNLKKSHVSQFAENYNPIAYQTKETYYRLVGQFLHSHKFESELDKKIFAMHGEGISIRDIVEHINTNGRRGKYVYKRLVHEKLQKLRKLMLEEYKATTVTVPDLE